MHRKVAAAETVIYSLICQVFCHILHSSTGL